MVFQETFLFADELRTNIDVDAAWDEYRVMSAAQVAQAHEFISALPGGYATLVGERGVTLSGGQRQRTALARALVRRPRVLLLDDATSAVDPVVEEAILTGLRRELDMTALIVAHRLSTIALADRVLFLDDGRIAAAGQHADLLTAVPAYARLVRAYERHEAQR
jgi:ABC-type multidrug transport system fused ATPase/permease subunit